MNSREDRLDKALAIEKEELKKEKKLKRKELYKKIVILLISIFVFIVIYSSLIEPNLITVNEYNIKSNKISEEFYGYKILEFGDIHYGTTINKNNINKIIDKINKTKPDIVIFTGDLVDKSYTLNDNDITILTNAFKNIFATLGKYAVLGEDDVINQSYNNITYDGGFVLLKNEFDLIYQKDNKPILIYGADDKETGNPSIKTILSDEYKPYYKIVICHEPDYFDEIKNNNIDLFLAGHSHNGQINIPYLKDLWLPKDAKKYYNNHYSINNTEIYITNGIGTTKLSLRFMSIPNMNLFRISK